MRFVDLKIRTKLMGAFGVLIPYRILDFSLFCCNIIVLQKGY